RPRQKAYAKRSRTGCRTCRVRRVKCDELPNACGNCTRTGRICDGYDVQRLPPRRVPGEGRGEAVARPAADSAFATIHAAIITKLQWKMTSDEGRCLSFFQHRSVPQLVGFFDSPLWQRLILQLCHADPAVYHAVVALGAVNQANEIAGRIPRPGERTILQNTQGLQNTWYRYAMEQSGRSIALVNKRRISRDPQLQQVILVCCILFITSELLCGNVTVANFHLRGGLRIIQTMNIRRRPLGLELSTGAVEECVMDSFLGFQQGSLYYGNEEVVRFDSEFIHEQPYENYLDHFHSLAHARQTWKPLEHTAFEFIAIGMKASDDELDAKYATLYLQQHRLISLVTKYLHQFEHFCRTAYGTTSFTMPITTKHQVRRKEYREAELTRISCLSVLLGVRTATYNKTGPPPDGHIAERWALLSAVETAMRNLGADCPTFTATSTMIPAMYMAAHSSPDYALPCHAIELLRSWRSEEGFMRSALSANLLEEFLKKDL
ncbi:Zn(II)2Cys6 transcription factor, partial [Aspergillus homomorphus CBS 101889]